MSGFNNVLVGDQESFVGIESHRRPNMLDEPLTPEQAYAKLSRCILMSDEPTIDREFMLELLDIIYFARSK